MITGEAARHGPIEVALEVERVAVRIDLGA